MDATRVLPWLGFGKPAEPPTEPVHRSGSESERPEDVTELQEQQHVQPGKRVEMDHPNQSPPRHPPRGSATSAAPASMTESICSGSLFWMYARMGCNQGQ